MGTTSERNREQYLKNREERKAYQRAKYATLDGRVAQLLYNSKHHAKQGGFSMGLSSGYPVKRKEPGGHVREDWTRGTAEVRVPLNPNSYMQRERLVARFGKTKKSSKRPRPKRK